MEWLVKESEEYRSQIRRGPFFKSLTRADRPNNLQWIHQLIHQSREFTQALCLRYSLCHDRRWQSVFAEHALEEADHPDQLIAWMNERSALREPHDVQVVGLNLLSEGVAFDFYSAVIPVLQRLKVLSGRYWKVHTDVDQHHLTMGMDLCAPVGPDSEKGRRYSDVLWHSASLYHQMLSSWVGEHVAPLHRLH